MTKFNIVRTDPIPYKDRILEFWDEYLPGTARGRFDWMKDNPAGPAHWFLAFEEKSGELSGMISVMPHHLFLDGRIVRAGIMGDLMVRSKDRAFGPGITLPKMVVSRLSEMNLDVIYTIPNPGAQKVMENCGFQEAMVLKHMVKPVSTRYYLAKSLPGSIARLAAPICDTLAVLIARETYYDRPENVAEEASVDLSFDDLWEEVRSQYRGVIGDHRAEYLQWRYFENPQFKFRLITCRGKNSALLGYLFFSMGEGKLGIYDILVKEKLLALLLLRELSSVARREGCQAMYLRVSANNPLFRLLPRCLFMDGRDDAKVLFVRADAISLGDWFFLSGDRNI